MSGAEGSQDRSTLAEEYVLGLLDDAEAASVAARLPRDAALAASVAAAEDRFAELSYTAPDLGAPDALWRRIEAEAAIPVPGAPAARAPARPPMRATPPRPAARTFRTAALAGLAASVLLGAGLVWQLLRAAPPQMVAVLLSAEGQPLVMVEAYGDDSARVVMLTDVALPAGQALQLWTKPDPAGPPVSLGVLPGLDSVTVRGPDLPAPQSDQLYEITFEQAGGSPTGLPTGPILGKGFARAPR